MKVIKVNVLSVAPAEMKKIDFWLTYPLLTPPIRQLTLQCRIWQCNQDGKRLTIKINIDALQKFGQSLRIEGTTLLDKSSKRLGRPHRVTVNLLGNPRWDKYLKVDIQGYGEIL